MKILRQKEYSINPALVEKASKVVGAGTVLAASGLIGRAAGKKAEKKELERLKKMGVEEETAKKLSKEKRNRVAGEVGTILPTALAIGGTRGYRRDVRIPIILASTGAGYAAGRIGAKDKKHDKK